MSTCTTAQLLSGSFVIFFSNNAALFCTSLVFATASPSMVNKLCFVQCTHAAFFLQSLLLV